MTIEVTAPEMLPAEIEAWRDYAAHERRKVEEFWGPEWRGPIRIHVSSEYRISRALTPALSGDRGFMEMPLHRVREKRAALLHEIVHVYAPAQCRMLAEGLAIYLQAKLGGNPAYPNFEEPLDSLAARLLPKDDCLERLARARSPAYFDMDPKVAYPLAGSFVRYLIEQRGLERFRELYRTEDYRAVYGEELPELERAWRRILARATAAPASSARE